MYLRDQTITNRTLARHGELLVCGQSRGFGLVFGLRAINLRVRKKSANVQKIIIVGKPTKKLKRTFPSIIAERDR